MKRYIKANSNNVLYRFQIGQHYHAAMLYGGYVDYIVTDRTSNTITLKESHISEDTWERVEDGYDTRPIVLLDVYQYELDNDLENPNSFNVVGKCEAVQEWEYRGDIGYLKARGDRDNVNASTKIQASSSNIKYVQSKSNFSPNDYDYSLPLPKHILFCGCGGRSWVTLTSDNLDTWDSCEEAVEDAKQYYKPGTYIYIYKIDINTREVLDCCDDVKISKVKASSNIQAAWYDPEDPNWTIDDEKDMYFDYHYPSKLTSKDWAYYLGKKLELSYYEYTMLLDDLNTLRGGEWVDSAAKVLDEHELALFKRFVHYYDETQDNFWGYEEDEL